MAQSPFPTYHEVVSAKEGQIVDANGKGIPGVTVVSDMHRVSGLWESSDDCLFAQIVTTDPNGFFSLPDVSDDLDGAKKKYLILGLFDTGNYFWHLTPISELRIVDNAGAFFSRANWTEYAFFDFRTRATRKGWNQISLDPITMIEAPLSFDQQMRYLWSAKHNADCHIETGRAQWEQLKMLFSHLVADLPCRLPDATPISGQALWDYSRLLQDKELSSTLILRGQPPSYPWHETTAWALCRAYKEKAEATRSINTGPRIPAPGGAASHH